MLASSFHVEPLMITELWLHPSYHKAHFLHVPLHMWCRYSKHTHILLVCLSLSHLSQPKSPTCNVQLQFGIRGSMLVQGTNYKLWNWNFYLWTDRRGGALIDTIWLYSCSVVKEGRKEGEIQEWAAETVAPASMSTGWVRGAYNVCIIGK